MCTRCLRFTGDEGFLSLCSNAGWGINNCWHTEDAKVRFRRSYDTSHPSVNRMLVVLVAFRIPCWVWLRWIFCKYIDVYSNIVFSHGKEVT